MKMQPMDVMVIFIVRVVCNSVVLGLHNFRILIIKFVNLCYNLSEHKNIWEVKICHQQKK
jgi:hypothetical protein